MANLRKIHSHPRFKKTNKKTGFYFSYYYKSSGAMGLKLDLMESQVPPHPELNEQLHCFCSPQAYITSTLVYFHFKT